MIKSEQNGKFFSIEMRIGEGETRFCQNFYHFLQTHLMAKLLSSFLEGKSFALFYSCPMDSNIPICIFSNSRGFMPPYNFEGKHILKFYPHAVSIVYLKGSFGFMGKLYLFFHLFLPFVSKYLIGKRQIKNEMQKS